LIDAERVDFVSVPTQDLERSKRFYGQTLGLQPKERANPAYPEFEAGNLTLALVLAEAVGQEFMASKASVALRVPDVAAAPEKLESEGVSFEGDKLDTGVCHMAFFTDADGNSLMLHRRYAPYE
jgi:predicted enzyme related to lactoylglutathione lyase